MSPRRAIVLGGVLAGLWAGPGTAADIPVCDPRFPGWAEAPDGASDSQRAAWKSRRAVVSLARQAGMPQRIRGPVVTTTPANLNRLDQTSELGRLIDTQAASCLAKLGVEVTDLDFQEGWITQRAGEGRFALSRQGQQAMQRTEAGAVLVGTYLKQRSGAHVELHLVRTNDRRLLASETFWVNRQGG